MEFLLYRIWDDEGRSDMTVANETYDYVMIFVGPHHYQGEVRHLKGWAEEKGLHYECVGIELDYEGRTLKNWRNLP